MAIKQGLLLAPDMTGQAEIHGRHPWLAVRIYKTYRDASISVVKNEP